MKEKFRIFWPIVGMGLVCLTFFYQFVFLGRIPIPGDIVLGMYLPWREYKWGYPTGVPVKNPITTDVVSFMYPMQMLAVDLWKSGKFPLWNPYILTGLPLLANFQSAPFSPTLLFYWLFSKPVAWGIQIVLQHFLAGLFVYLWLRLERLSRWGSLTAGIIYAFSGFNIIWSQWNGHALAAAWIPLLLLVTSRWLKKGGIWNGISISVLLVAQIFSGYPQIVLYTLLALGIIGLINFSWQRFLGIGVFIVLGLSLAAPQLIPGYELLSLSQRQTEPHPYEWAFLPWKKTITFVAPDFFGNHATSNYWGPQDYTSNTGFVGVVAVVLALSALSLRPKSKLTLLGAVLAGLGLILSFATPISVGLWKSGFLGFQAASAHRALILFDLGIAVLAGVGINKRNRWTYFWVGALLSIFALYALFIHQPVGLRNLILPTLVLVGLIIGRKYVLFVVGLLLLELFYFGWKFTPFFPKDLIFPSTPVLKYIQSQKKPFRITGKKVIPINMHMPYKIETLEGYDAVYPVRISKFLAALNSGDSTATPLGRYGSVDNNASKLLNLINVQYRLEDINDSVQVVRNTQSLPRSFMIYAWEVLPNPDLILKRLLNKDFSMDQKIILEKDTSLVPEGVGVAQVVYEHYSENQSLIKVTTSVPGLLFTSDLWFPGWRAEVDGQSTEIYRADYAFRAIPIPAGEHKIHYYYHPDSFYIGLIMFIGSYAICLFAILGNKLWKKRLF